jgi:hypothetical protein
MVLASPDRVETERADQPRLLHRLGEAAVGIVAGRVLRVQVDAELHFTRLTVFLSRWWKISSRPFILSWVSSS